MKKLLARFLSPFRVGDGGESTVPLRTMSIKSRRAEPWRRVPRLACRVLGRRHPLLRTADSITVEIDTGFLTVAGDPEPASRAVSLLASLLRRVHVLSSTSMETVSAQNVTKRKHTKNVREMTKVSTNLTRKVAALTERTFIALPPLSKKKPGNAELPWLDSELERVMTNFRSRKDPTEAKTDDVASPLSVKPQAVN